MHQRRIGQVAEALAEIHELLREIFCHHRVCSKPQAPFIPAQAGIQGHVLGLPFGVRWVPAFAGTNGERSCSQSSDLLHLAARRRADDRFAHRRAVDDLVGRDREGRRRPRAARAKASKQARMMSSFSASQISSGPLTGWNLQAPNSRVRRSSEDAPATWVTPSSRMPALGAEHLDAEARAGRGDGAEIARHAGLHAEQHRGGVVGARSAPRARSSGNRRGRSRRTDRSWRRSRARPSAQGRRPAPPYFMARHAVGLQEQRVGKGHVAFDVLDDAELAGADPLAQLDHLRMEAPVVADADRRAWPCARRRPRLRPPSWRT